MVNKVIYLTHEAHYLMNKASYLVNQTIHVAYEAIYPVNEPSCLLDKSFHPLTNCPLFYS
jgi:hypothetical protein